MSLTITITPTEDLVTVEGVSCRLWHGVTAEGVSCLVLVHRIAVADTGDSAEFDRALAAMPAPRTLHSDLLTLGESLESHSGGVDEY